MKIQPHPVLVFSPALLALLEAEIAKSKVKVANGLTLNFRDPGYSEASGGFHPVEIAVDAAGAVLYITDFAYFGQGDFAELGKAIDFDFSYGVFQNLGREYPLQEGAELFALWQQNFCEYVRMGVFQVTHTES